jgi:Kef-type K+ transport system membrane component KefB
MLPDTNTSILILCGIIIASYLFEYISRWLKIPSVLLLIGSGIGLQYGWPITGFSINDIRQFVELLGTIGLIMIVLEASLDLKLARNKIPVIRNSFLSAMLILCVSSVLVAVILYLWFGNSFRSNLVYAIPLSIISSAIVIPSVTFLTTDKKEFVIYEASFSDIMGIMLFNFFIAEQILTIESVGAFLVSFLIIITASMIISFILLFLIARFKHHIKYFLLLAILMALYAFGKMYHWPSLLLILCFGLIINNADRLRSRLHRFLDFDALPSLLVQLKTVTSETAFVIRTYFFILFGFSVNLNLLLNWNVLILGSLILLALISVRFLYLKLFLKERLMPELFLMPRGLITIILFYSIPKWLKNPSFEEGLLFYIIICSTILMMIGLSLANNKKEIDIQALN